MALLEVFDPPLCCSSGVCGPAVDPALARFAADLDWLKRQGVEIRRHNLAQEPAAFAAHPAVQASLSREEALPYLFANGTLIRQGAYPTRAELAAALKLALPLDTAPTATGCCSGKGSCGCA